jgi:hypothetical protein
MAADEVSEYTHAEQPRPYLSPRCDRGRIRPLHDRLLSALNCYVVRNFEYAADRTPDPSVAAAPISSSVLGKSPREYP